MTLDTHKRVLGILHLVYAAVSLIFILGTTFFLSTFLPILEDEVAREAGTNEVLGLGLIFGGIQSFIVIVGLVANIPSILGGIGILTHKNWGLILCLIAGILSLFSIPFGTALGVYSIYVFYQDNQSKKETSEGFATDRTN